MTVSSRAAQVALAASLAPLLPTQFLPAWRPAPVLSARIAPAMAYDHGRERLVLFGGSDTGETWEWHGSGWLLRQSPNNTSCRRSQS